MLSGSELTEVLLASGRAELVLPMSLSFCSLLSLTVSTAPMTDRLSPGWGCSL